ncbi:MAG: DUF4153 domain-containing protein [Clostridiaceae bacterium]|nr:DUF4153 domain-containing protein [Clostridiaceae bacterium]
MKLIAYFKERSKALLYALARFPAVVAALIALAVVMTVEVAAQESYPRLTMALTVTVFLALFAHILLEKAGSMLFRLLPIAVAGAGFVLYYFLGLLEFEADNLYYGAGRYPLQTVVVCVIFLLLFLAIQSLRHGVVFGSVFMSVFKAFFTTLLFSAVIWGGLSLIIAAIDELLFRLNPDIFPYIAIWVWILVAPVIFMSLLLTFRTDEEGKAADGKRISIPAFFRVLLLYVIVPLLAVYTLVLVIYLMKTVLTGEDRELLEPLILSYSIAVIVVFFLISEIEGKYPAVCRFIFPKIMGVIALYQLIVSLIKAGNEGVLFSDYFLILFSAFAVVAAVTMSILKKEKNHIHILILAAFALFSILPLVNFYGVSVRSQQQVLVDTLEKNGMLRGDEVISNESVPKEEQVVITQAAEFLNRQGELGEIVHLNTQGDFYKNFRAIFGFEPNHGYEQYYGDPKLRGIYIDRSQAIPLGDADYVVWSGIFVSDAGNTVTELGTFTHEGTDYTVQAEIVNGDCNIVLIDSTGMKLITAEVTGDIEKIIPSESDGKPETVAPEQMSLVFKGDGVLMKVYLMSVNLYDREDYNVRFEIDPMVLITFTDTEAE